MPRWAGLTQAQALRPARQPASPAHARVCGGVSLALRALKVLGGHWAGSRQVADGETETHRAWAAPAARRWGCDSGPLAELMLRVPSDGGVQAGVSGRWGGGVAHGVTFLASQDQIGRAHV